MGTQRETDMIFLILTPEVEADIQRVRKHAEDSKYHRARGTVPGDTQMHTTLIPMGFKVVYSIDAGEMLGTWIRHMSVSVVATEGRTSPSRETMRLLAGLFGFSEAASMGTMPSDPDYVIHALEMYADESAPA